MIRHRNNRGSCSYVGGQFIVLSSIFAAILSQEIESLEELELLAAFLVALADQLALAIIARSQCESSLEGGGNPIVEIVLDEDKYIKEHTQQKPSKKKIKKVVKKVKVRNKDSKY